MFLRPGLLCADIIFSNSEWNFGEVPETKPVSNTFTVENTGTEQVYFTLLSTCGCLTVEPPKFEVGPGEKMNWTVTFEPEGYSGEFRNPIIIRTDDPDLPKAFFQVHGRIRTAGSFTAATASGPEGEGAAAGREVTASGRSEEGRAEDGGAPAGVVEDRKVIPERLSCPSIPSAFPRLKPSAYQPLRNGHGKYRGVRSDRAVSGGGGHFFLIDGAGIDDGGTLYAF